MKNAEGANDERVSNGISISRPRRRKRGNGLRELRDGYVVSRYVPITDHCS
jgi:hypothetical protein